MIYLKEGEEVVGNEWPSLIGLGLILFSVFAFSDRTPSPSLFTLVPTCGGALIILYTSPDTAVFRLLSHKCLVGLGLISYSAYLWHQPLLTLARNSVAFYGNGRERLITIGLVILTFVLSLVAGEKLFYDYGHYTLAGARFFGKRVDDLRWFGDLCS